MVRLAAFLLRLVVVTFAGALIAGATLTLAAERVNEPRPTLVPVSVEPPTLVVPEVVGQAYVFAKGILQDNGFAWHVTGSVDGYAANIVADQQPAAGTSVIDTGAPTITLMLVRNPRYRERGTPENDAPYSGTRIELPKGRTGRPSPTPTLEPVQVPTSPLVDPNETVPAPAGATSVPLPRVASRPAKAKPVRRRAPTPAPPAKLTASAGPRRPDFTVPGAPAEPADAQPLPGRAKALRAWIEKHRDATASNLSYWLYEHAYIVAGARFGWWRGAEALKVLIAVDRRAQALWAVGQQSEATARRALAEVQARADG